MIPKEDRIYFEPIPYMANGFAKACHCGYDPGKKRWFTTVHHRFLKQLILLYGLDTELSHENALTVLKTREETSPEEAMSI